MEYIRSKDIFFLMRDTLKLIDARPVVHGTRVAYFLLKMLELKGGYEEFELADIVYLATFHDIGAYKTDNLNDMIHYDTSRFLPHSIYGYLFFYYLSPLEDMAKVILYHHTDYEILRKLDYKYRELAEYMNVAEKMDNFKHALGDKFDVHTFKRQAGTKLSTEGLELFYEADKRQNILEKVRSGSYKEELDGIVEYMIFTNENKKKYMDMLMYCSGFKSEDLVLNTATCLCITEELGRRASLPAEERETLHYGALLHDIGMLAVPLSIMNAPRPLTEDEWRKVKAHVDLGERILINRLRPDVVKLVGGHHERGNGKGYPSHMVAAQMNRAQRILQVADTVTAMVNVRCYKKRQNKAQIITELKREAAAGRLSKQFVGLFIGSYDDIMQRVLRETEEILQKYNKLNLRYHQVYEKRMGAKKEGSEN